MFAPRLLPISRRLVWTVLIIHVIILATQSATVLDTIEAAKEKAQKTAQDLSNNLCLINENCNQQFFTLKNYCCGVQCCDLIRYIGRNDKYWENFASTFEEPRAINIILAILFTLIVVLLIGLITKVICCLLCGCCGTKKYVIVGRGE
jgi:hypothetical protein